MYSGLDSSCVSCHLSDYQATRTIPNHAAAGFPTNCELCHNTTQWDGAGFTHAFWPLTGAHSQATCTDCHTGGVYAGTPNTCVSCHLSDYQGANDPDHQALGFPTTCQDCHSTSTWDGATFDHDFPIGPGDDHGFLSCVDCHTTSGSSNFSCTHCHPHRQSRMDDVHERRGRLRLVLAGLLQLPPGQPGARLPPAEQQSAHAGPAHGAPHPAGALLRQAGRTKVSPAGVLPRGGTPGPGDFPGPAPTRPGPGP
ncbi:MAG: hypothetical protein R3F33_10915 [Planctomycetota bacterium]